MAEMIFLLVVAHALCDYPLQGDFLARAKDRNTKLGKMFWPHALFAHSMIHGGAVLLITGLLPLAIAEVIIHAVTDWLKCEKRIGLNTDQAIHLLCKIVWAAVAAFGVLHV
ncbi:DUF3307 domain-containing protein [Achromobacter sp. MFA1 R4]|uniref:DUF3307 domain-containing protein n=1 Tax=Achromobacter sp. MFA1 R4 TaxID=1881016 RepID=UPI0009537110|nr:DUF3307 domain-containing protein [Achromobacter sp. MFA1 R4]SIT25252.1 Protein of unknown function [Achromobacter sp. MFA1 R4]